MAPEPLASTSRGAHPGDPPPAPEGAEPFFSRETGKWTIEGADGELEWDGVRWIEVVRLSSRLSGLP